MGGSCPYPRNASQTIGLQGVICFEQCAKGSIKYSCIVILSDIKTSGGARRPFHPSWKLSYFSQRNLSFHCLTRYKMPLIGCSNKNPGYAYVSNCSFTNLMSFVECVKNLVKQSLFCLSPGYHQCKMRIILRENCQKCQEVAK